MKKAVIALTVVALLSIGVAAYANMWGWGGGWGGPMMRGAYSAEEQKALDETYALRKDLHEKRFELMEAMRKGEYEKAEAIEKEITGQEEKLYEATGNIAGARSPNYAKGRPGRGWGRCGGDYGCPGPCSR